VLIGRISISISGAAEAARVIRTTAVAEVAAEELGVPKEQARGLLGEVSVSSDDEFGTGFLTITAQSPTPERAAGVANAFAAAITSSRTEEAVEALNDTIATVEEQLDSTGRNDPARDTLSDRVQQLRALRSAQDDATLIIEPAVPPTEPIAPNPGRATLLAGVLALLLAAGLVPLFEMLDRRLREPRDVEDLDLAPLLGVIPERAFPGSLPGPSVREAFQTLRAGLMYFDVDRELKSVMVTSPRRGDGKTTVATNLAVALAQDNQEVILIDCDLRRPQAAYRLGVDEAAPYGMEAVLVEQRPLDEALVLVDGVGGNLRVLAGGVVPNASVVLGSKRMRSLLDELTDSADIVIVDTPPLLAVSDAIPLVNRVSGAVLVARLGGTKAAEMTRAAEVLASAQGNLVGVVATGAKTGGLPGLGYGYGYGYGYGGYEGDPSAAGPVPGARSNGGKRRLPFSQRGR
ncbi:MAG: polysaccharide biosynthesis tyrosine autokinase, partial [Solirubrobacterales bacterium]